MAQGIRFFEKSKIDLDAGTDVVITIADAVATDTGSTVVDSMRNRNNRSGWGTVGSTDAANTAITVVCADNHLCDSLLFLGMNWKNYTVQYWTGAAYADFDPPISVTSNTESSKFHKFAPFEFAQFKVIITAAQVLNDDKFCKQMIMTKQFGQFQREPRISKAESSQERRMTNMISGKANIIRNVGGFGVNISKQCWDSGADMKLIEDLYNSSSGFLVWLCGGDEKQFKFPGRPGYRLQDLYLMDFKNEYTCDWHDGNFNAAPDIKLDLVEIV